MSYSFSTEVIERGDDVQVAIETAYYGFAGASPLKGQEDNGTAAEARYAINQVKLVAPSLVSALGPNWSKVRVVVVGHANPGNVKTPGWSDEFCQVKVDVVEYASES